MRSQGSAAAAAATQVSTGVHVCGVMHVGCRGQALLLGRWLHLLQPSQSALYVFDPLQDSQLQLHLQLYLQVHLPVMGGLSLQVRL
jgi:hypothetical protein